MSEAGVHAVLDIRLGQESIHDISTDTVVYTRIGSNKGKTPEHNQAKHTKHPHSLEWHNSTITIVFPSTSTDTNIGDNLYR